MRTVTLALAGALLGCAANPIAVDGGPPPPPVDAGPPAVDAGADPCAVCDPIATCDRAAATCECPPGYDDVSGDGTRCVMGSPCSDGTHDCDRNASCASSTVPPLYACTCDPGYAGDGVSCADANECADGTDDCAPNATCTNTTGSFECACDPPFVGDGRTCLRDRTVLIYYDGPETLADDAVRALGFTANITSDGAAFNVAYDARGFDLIIWDSASGAMPSGADTRLSNWATLGRPLIFSFWDLESAPALAASLSVTASPSYRTFRPVYADPAATVDFFSFRESIPTPLGGADRSGINGAELDLMADGFVVARLDSETGPGAITSTRGGRVITHGFSPHDVAMTDADADGTPDMEELYVNEMLYVFR